MAKMVYSRDEDIIRFITDEGEVHEFECRHDFVEGYNEDGEPHESLPLGEYECNADPIEEVNYGPAYGSFYINTGDSRERDIHGGGSGLEDPYDDFQGWVPTYGCLRMQNADGKRLTELMFEYGNVIPLTVQEEPWEE